MSRFLFLPFLLTACGASQAGTENARLAADVKAGQAIYADQCASCHGDGVEGGSAPTLFDDVWVHGGSDAAIASAIKIGLEAAGMPAFGPGLSDTDTRNVIAYIRNGERSLVSTAPIDAVPSVTADIQIDDWVTGLNQPWGFVFTGPDSALVTEKSGQLRRIENGALLPEPVKNIPKVNDGGQGGLLDVALDPNYTDNGFVYLAFSHPVTPGSNKAMTKIVRGKIAGGTWTGEDVLFEAKPEHYVASGRHFGSRITFDDAGHLFFSIGDRGRQDEAQDLTRPNGKIHRINLDGTIPTDNPFVGVDGAYGSIWSYGNRNAQGLIIHPDTGVLWETEHGPKGGDELNVIRPGANYGWPVISFGRNYNGTELTPYTAKLGMEQPASQWTPSIAACGLDVYTGDLFPEWKGRLLAGALRYETVRLIDVDGETYKGEMSLIKDQGRVRDVTTGPDGAIYVALPNKIVRISPNE